MINKEKAYPILPITLAALAVVLILVAIVWAAGFFGSESIEEIETEVDKTSELEEDQPNPAEDPTWADLAVGEDHVCAIHTSGSLWCQGNNTFGQIGDSTRTSRQRPVQIGDSLDWNKVTTGATHSCAARNDGALYCWGRNDHGQFGNGTRDDYPAPVAQASGDGGEWTALSAGHFHTCGIREDRAYCWGDNRRGQLGDGSNESRLTPVPVAGDVEWSALSAATYYTCGIHSDGTLWCWGGSDLAHPVAETTTPTKLGEHNDWVDLTAGDYHTCAIRSEGELHCWGNAAGNRLPDVDSFDVVEFSDEPSGDQKWSAISARARRSCGITAEGSISCWGQSDHLPAEPATDHEDWSQISVGRYLGCGIRHSGDLHCWTDGDLGEPWGSAASLQAKEGSLKEKDLLADDLPGPEPVEFFATTEESLHHYQVDGDGLQLLREVSLPHPAESAIWVPGRGLAITVLGQSEEAEDFCAGLPAGCQARTLLFLPADDIQGELQTLELPLDLYWPRVGRLEYSDSPLGDDGVLISNLEGELWLARCHSGWEKVGCTLSSSMRLFPTPEPVSDRYYSVVRRQVSLAGPDPVEKPFSKPPGADLVTGDQLLCLSATGDSYALPDDNPYAHFGSANWASIDPSIFEYSETHDAGNTDNPEHLRPRSLLRRPCNENLHGWDPQFGSQGVFVLRHNGQREIYFDGESIGIFAASDVVFPGIQEPTPKEPVDLTFDLPELREPMDDTPFTDASALYTKAREAWMNFPSTRPACSGGFYSVANYGSTMPRLYCHFRNYGTLGVLEAALGMPVFLEGPHLNGSMNLRSRDSFGHYNPEFVRTLHLWAIPVLQDEHFKNATGYIYNEHLKSLADSFESAYRSLIEDPENYEAAQRAYRESIGDSSTWFQSRDFSDEHYNAVRFWARRGIDGTHELFAEGLRMLREAYE